MDQATLKQVCLWVIHFFLSLSCYHCSTIITLPLTLYNLRHQSIHPSIHPYMALQPLPGLGLPHKTPPFHICRYSPFRALASPIRRLHSIYVATAPSGPWPPSQDASIHPYFQLFSSVLLSPAAVMHPSGLHPPIWFLVFPLVLWHRSFRLKPFLESILLPVLLCGL